MHTDPIADLLTRIRNAMTAGHETVRVPYSKMKMNVLAVIKNNQFIEDFKEVKEGDHPEIEVSLKDDRRDIHFRRISSPGQRIYVKKDQLKRVKSGLGITIISTSHGVMCNNDAMKKNLGGELICEIY